MLYVGDHSVMLAPSIQVKGNGGEWSQLANGSVIPLACALRDGRHS